MGKIRVHQTPQFTVQEFVAELQRLNPDQAHLIKEGTKHIAEVAYSGDPEKLNLPDCFTAARLPDGTVGWSDVEALDHITPETETKILYQFFEVSAT